AQGPSEAVLRALVLTVLIKDIDLTAVLSGDKDVISRKAREGRRHPADTTVKAVRNVQIAIRTCGNAKGRIELGLGRWAPVATIAIDGISRDGRDDAVYSHPANDAIVGVRDVHTPIRPDGDARGKIELGLGSRAAVAAIAT